MLKLEAQRLRAAIPAGANCIALDERGRTASTQELARLLNKMMAAHSFPASGTRVPVSTHSDKES